MQTFLPYPSFHKSARVLDRARLGKQRVETKQILMALNGESKGWTNHPATRMWKGYESALAAYGAIMCSEWITRGYSDSLSDWFIVKMDSDPMRYPWWLGDPAFHASHRSNLLRKDRAWYEQWGWSEPDDLPYVWPVEK